MFDWLISLFLLQSQKLPVAIKDAANSFKKDRELFLRSRDLLGQLVHSQTLPNRKPENVFFSEHVIHVAVDACKFSGVFLHYVVHVVQVVPWVMVDCHMVLVAFESLVIGDFVERADEADAAHVDHHFGRFVSESGKGIDDDAKDNVEHRDVENYENRHVIEESDVPLHPIFRFVAFSHHHVSHTS